MAQPFHTGPDIDPPKDLEEAAQRWEEFFEAIRDGMKTLQAKQIEFEEEVNRGLVMLPHLGPYLVAGRQWVLRLWKQVSDYMIDLLTRPGNPAALLVASEKWGTNVRKVLEAIQAEVDGEEPGPCPNTVVRKVDADRHWTGPAAKNYESTATRQKEALGNAVTLANTLQNGLQDVAFGLIALYSALLAAVIALLAELVAGIATIVLDGIGIAVIVGALATFLGQMVALGGAFAGWLSTTKSFHNALDQAGFENEKWEQREDLLAGW